MPCNIYLDAGFVAGLSGLTGDGQSFTVGETMGLLGGYSSSSVNRNMFLTHIPDTSWGGFRALSAPNGGFAAFRVDPKTFPLCFQPKKDIA